MNAQNPIRPGISSLPPSAGDRENDLEGEGARARPLSQARLRRSAPYASSRPVPGEHADEAWRHTLVDGVWLTVHGARPPTDAEWQRHVDELLDAGERVRAILILTEGPGPDARQRATLKALPELLCLPRAVVTGSALARGAATAVHWLGGEVRSFAPDELGDALAYLGAGAAAGDELKWRAAQMKAALGWAAG
ncbi:MAG TPA: hypothetical protein VFS43_13490 [Polyangiaceae bacterium]|nr:hypothetical protein [Polyangiaceae bacterium]